MNLLPQNLTTLIAKAHVVKVVSNDNRSYGIPLRAYLEEAHQQWDQNIIERCIQAGTVVEIHVFPYSTASSYKVAAENLNSALDAAWEAFPSELMQDVRK